MNKNFLKLKDIKLQIQKIIVPLKNLPYSKMLQTKAKENIQITRKDLQKDSLFQNSKH